MFQCYIWRTKRGKDVILGHKANNSGMLCSSIGGGSIMSLGYLAPDRTGALYKMDTIIKKEHFFRIIGATFQDISQKVKARSAKWTIRLQIVSQICSVSSCLKKDNTSNEPVVLCNAIVHLYYSNSHLIHFGRTDIKLFRQSRDNWIWSTQNFDFNRKEDFVLNISVCMQPAYPEIAFLRMRKVAHLQGEGFIWPLWKLCLIRHNEWKRTTSEIIYSPIVHLFFSCWLNFFCSLEHKITFTTKTI